SRLERLSSTNHQRRGGKTTDATDLAVACHHAWKSTLVSAFASWSVDFLAAVNRKSAISGACAPCGRRRTAAELTNEIYPGWCASSPAVAGAVTITGRPACTEVSTLDRRAVSPSPKR